MTAICGGKQADMIRMGAAFRGEVHEAEKGGMDVFKGENIVACRWKATRSTGTLTSPEWTMRACGSFADISPKQGFAFHRISPALTCAPFDPKKCVFLNTATLFFPKPS